MLPDWLPESLWSEFRKMRVKIKHPMTPYAETLILIKLDKWHTEGADVIAVVNESIERGWSGVFLNGHAKKTEATTSAQISPNSCKKCGSTTWVRLDRYKHCERCRDA